MKTFKCGCGQIIYFENTHCLNCGERFIIKDFNWSCPKCQESSTEIVAGNELYIESIEVE